jgi:DNA-binding XRE family transcriptional regulator
LKHETVSGLLPSILPEIFSCENLSGKMSDNKANWFLDMRKELGLTQEEVAAALGVTPRTILNWENGHHEPKLTIKQVKALCRLLQRPLDQVPDEFPFYGSVNGNAEA